MAQHDTAAAPGRWTPEQWADLEREASLARVQDEVRTEITIAIEREGHDPDRRTADAHERAKRLAGPSFIAAGSRIIEAAGPVWSTGSLSQAPAIQRAAAAAIEDLDHLESTERFAAAMEDPAVSIPAIAQNTRRLAGIAVQLNAAAGVCPPIRDPSPALFRRPLWAWDDALSLDGLRAWLEALHDAAVRARAQLSAPAQDVKPAEDLEAVSERPTTSDLCAAAGISNPTFGRIRKDAGIEAPPADGRAAATTYSPEEVDRLIAAAMKAGRREARKIAQHWAKWSTGGGISADSTRQ
ncbi:MAG: hypothetical protein KF699_00585 [Phycisphaeraceae bacterium]|nr:hypothetical protein [Phycisphaeraceae bacterium]